MKQFEMQKSPGSSLEPLIWYNLHSSGTQRLAGRCSRTTMLVGNMVIAYLIVHDRVSHKQLPTSQDFGSFSNPLPLLVVHSVEVAR